MHHLIPTGSLLNAKFHPKPVKWINLNTINAKGVRISSQDCRWFNRRYIIIVLDLHLQSLKGRDGTVTFISCLKKLWKLQKKLITDLSFRWVLILSLIHCMALSNPADHLICSIYKVFHLKHVMTVSLLVPVKSALSTKYLVQEINFSRLSNSIFSSTMSISFSTEYLRKFKWQIQ